MKKRILVIGLQKVKEVTTSIDWMSCLKHCPVLGDYDSIVLYLPTLTEEIVKQFTKEFVEEFKKEFLEAFFANKDISCVTAREIKVNQLSSYSIFPFSLEVVSSKEGTAFKNMPKGEYFKKLTKWDHYFEMFTNKKESGFYWRSRPGFTTYHDKAISFVVDFMEVHAYGDESVGVVYFIPSQTNTSHEEGVHNALDFLFRSTGEEKLPDYLNNILVEGEKEIINQIESSETQIRAEIAKRDLAKSKLDEIYFKKSVLVLKGGKLVEAVKKIFAEMRLTITGDDKFEEDGIFEYKENRIPTEIKGHDTGAKEDDLSQIYKHITKASIVGSTKVKGLLIENTFITEPPNKRSEAFHPKVVKIAEPMEVCLLSTITLFQYWNDYRKTGKTTLGDDILNTVGELKFKKK